MNVMTDDQRFEVNFFFSVVFEHIDLNEISKKTSTNKVIAQRFRKYIISLGVRDVREITDACSEAFVNLPSRRGEKLSRPSASAQKARRTGLRAIRNAARELGYTLTNFNVDFPVEPLGPVTRYICKTEDISALRNGAPWGMCTSGLPAVLALAEAGASNDEIRVIRGHNIDLEQQVVRLPGTGSLRERENQLTDWGKLALSSRIDELEDLSLIVFSTMQKESISNGAVSNAFNQIVRNAGLATRGLRLDSVRAWRARQVLNNTGQVEDVARFLGLHTLDGAARFVEYDWQGKS